MCGTSNFYNCMVECSVVVQMVQVHFLAGPVIRNFLHLLHLAPKVIQTEQISGFNEMLCLTIKLCRYVVIFWYFSAENKR